MIFRKDPQKLKERLQDLKKIKAGGMRFTIRRINPLLDFTSDKMPQIFTEVLSVRKEDPNRTRTNAELLKMQEDMYSIIEAGVVEPQLVPIGVGEKRGKEGGITVEDLFRDPAIGYDLYMKILDHSLNRFKGIKKLFFSIRTKYLHFTVQRKIMEQLQSDSSSQMEGTV